jgi:hypothetical protein
MVCPACYQDYISECSIGFVINAGLTADTDYSALITDKFNHKYKIDFTTDGAGIGYVYLEGIPEGLLNPYSGIFKVEILDVEWNKVQMTINGDTYTCIEFDVHGEVYSKTWLGEFTEESVSS